MFVNEAISSELRAGGEYAGHPTVAVMEDPPFRWLLSEFPIPAGVWREHSARRVQGIIGDHGKVLAADVESLPFTDGMYQAPAHVSAPAQPERKSNYINLHAHSEYSPLDGLARIDEMVDQAIADGQSHLAVTDHGVCAGHLELQQVARKKGIKPIFGIEANFIGNALDKSPDTRGAYKHFILLAKNQVGLHNLWRASTLSHLPNRFYARSRMDWAILEECSEGLIASTACLRGPLSDMILDGDEEGALQTIARLKGIFGDDLFLELHLNQLDKQKQINEALVSLGQQTSTPLVAVGDSHYACREHADAHTVWIAAQTNKDLQDEADLFAGHEEYHLHSEADALASLSYLPESAVDEAIRNTHLIAEQCDASIVSRPTTPVYHRHEITGEQYQGAELDAVVLERICRDAMVDRFPDEVNHDDERAQVYQDRFDEEMETLRTKGFCGYMLINWDLANWVRKEGILMGPGRGSAAGSLVSFLLGVTQVDPIEADLLFERFISPGRTELPDIDSDYPATKRSPILEYISDRWGSEHVVRVGTVTRLRNKGVFKDVARVFKGSEHEVDFADQEAISKIIDEAESSTAGLGLPWDALWDEEGERLEVYREKYPEMFKYAEILVGRLKSYGKHPAGVVIDPDTPIIDSVPMRQGDDDYPVTEWPMEVLDELGLVKFDVLTLRTLDTLQVCMDLIEDDPKFAGKVPHPHTWREQYKDPQVWDMICDNDTLGVFQLETPTCTRLNARMNPRSIADLCAILTLVRPGPVRSGLTDAYIRRRDGEEVVTYAHPLLETVLHKTYGTMIYQEDIMHTVKVIAGYTSAEADEVRKILGKKKVDKIAAEGERFVSRSMGMGIDQQLAEHMFHQMEEFARYSFNKSHSWAYAMLAFWCAWFKTHFPAHFIVASLSTADKGRYPEFVNYARRRGFTIDLPDINESGEHFTVSGGGIGIRYGLSSIKGLGEAAAAGVIEERPYSDLEDFIERRDNRRTNWGKVKLLAHIGAVDSLSPDHNRNEIEDFVDQMSTGKLERCRFMNLGTTPADGTDMCCGFDWDNEPPNLSPKTGKPMKQKPQPKKCTKACRQYDPVSAIEWKQVPPPDETSIREREMEVLGLYISSTPFDSLDLETVASLSDIESGSDGEYEAVAIVKSVRKRTDAGDRQFGFVTLMLPDGETSAVCFSSTWRNLHPMFHPGTMIYVSLNKTSRGLQLANAIPFNPTETRS